MIRKVKVLTIKIRALPIKFKVLNVRTEA